LFKALKTLGFSTIFKLAHLKLDIAVVICYNTTK